ncbi:hypothetical protein [Sphingobacterium sp. LRF_L2]|uniref:hypothetical protein n=1 Tax=Sphingobacterium sp. LRF_L2 TaxID=3369421 RepID=UPI003F60302C
MKRRESQLAKVNEAKVKTLYDIDFLLGVYDDTRMKKEIRIARIEQELMRSAFRTEIG